MDEILQEINEKGEFPEYVLWSEEGGVQPDGGEGSRYKYMDSGGSGKIYESLSGDNTVIKLMQVRKEKFDSEVHMQSEAAKYGLAPQVLDSGCSNEVEGLHLCFILMPLLTDHLDLYDSETVAQYQSKVCQYIDTLTSKLLMVNTVDPRRHFYEVLRPGGIRELQMIDFGEFQWISPHELAEKRDEMAEACGVVCAFKSKRRIAASKSRSRSKRRKAGGKSRKAGYKRRSRTRRKSRSRSRNL